VSDTKLLALRHLAASRFYLPQELPFEEAQDAELDFFDDLFLGNYNEALDSADQMGIMSNAPDEFWIELENAALCLGNIKEASRFNAIRKT
jgi:hypothetical protein